MGISYNNIWYNVPYRVQCKDIILLLKLYVKICVDVYIYSHLKMFHNYFVFRIYQTFVFLECQLLPALIVLIASKSFSYLTQVIVVYNPFSNFG